MASNKKIILKRYGREEIIEREKGIKLDVKKFILFHKDRISLLKGLVEKKVHHKLSVQISFMGFESLAKVLYPQEDSSEERFISLLSTLISRDEATRLYKIWRCSLIHEGFIADQWTCLEAWGEGDISFLSFPSKLRSSTEFPPESIILMYNRLIDNFDKYFTEKNIKEIELE